MYARRMAGFSLIEMLLTVGIISLLAGISLPLYNSFLARNDLDIAAQQVADAMRRAQIYSRGMKEDFAWSVERQANSVILFRGTNFGGRNTLYDETVSFPGIAATGINEVQFAKLTGLPNATGSIVLTSNVGDTKTVTINAQGMVDY